MDTIHSPLTKVVRDKKVNEILARIQRAVVNNDPLVIPNNDVKYMAKKFQEGIIQGEKRLYDFSKLVLANFCTECNLKIDLLVWGRCTNPFHEEIIKKRYAIEGGFSKLTEKSKTESGTRFITDCPVCLNRIPIIASFVQFFPKDPNSREILNFISTRIKTTSNLSYKIADMVFGIDRMLKQDKVYGKFSLTVLDIYGLKLVTSTKEDIDTIREWFEKHKKIRVLDTDDYLGKNKKQSGFQAYIMICKYNNQIFEIQCQSRRMYNEELYNRETNHQTYKERQMSRRRKLGAEYIMLYEALNRLFQSPKNISDMDYIELGFGRGRY